MQGLEGCPNALVSAMSWSAFLAFFSVIMLNHTAYPWEVSHCGNQDGPEIRFPFWLKNNSNSQPHRCGFPDHFGLSCTSEGGTVLNLTTSLTLHVSSIDYVKKLIHLYDFHGCLPRVLLHLNLSSSPFQYDDYQYSFVTFNCSWATHRGMSALVSTIPCLSSVGINRVYAMSSTDDIQNYPLFNCRKIGTMFSYLPDSFELPGDLTLQWAKPYCGDCCYHKSKGDTAKRKAAGMAVGSFLFVVAAVGLYHLHTVDKEEKERRAKIVKFLEDYRALKPARYSYADIKRVTNHFKHKLGQGGFGTVFKGTLSNEIFVAVKILNATNGDGEEFINEVGTMGRIHHVNVVRLVGFCADGFRKALVYEFLPNETLEKFIYSESIKKALGWKKLKDIALGIAKGIEYLHQGCDQQILHFDIKPNNVLLDHSYNPKISDFGLAKLCSKEQSVVSMTTARGTIGYIAPEVFSRNFGSASHKSDVYSFGMLLLDIVEGRKNDEVPPENYSQGYFPDWIYNKLERGEVIGTGIDTVRDANIAKHLTIVGLWCIQWYPTNRPSMKAAVQMLEGEGNGLTMPPNPFSCTNAGTGSTVTRGRDFNIELEAISESE